MATFDRIINLAHTLTRAAERIACINRERVEQFYSYEDQTLLTQAVVDVSAIKADLATVCKAHGVSSQPLLAWIRDAMEAATESSPVPDAPSAALAVLDELKAAAALAEEEAAKPRADAKAATAPAKGEGGGKAVATGEWLARAMLRVRDNPEWSDAQIARTVGINKSQLARSREYKMAAALARKQGPMHKGKVDIDPDTKARAIEAVDDGGESQEEIDARIDQETAKTQRNPQRQ